ASLPVPPWPARRCRRATGACVRPAANGTVTASRRHFALSRRGAAMAEGKARRRRWAGAAAGGLVAVAAWAVAWLRGPQLPGYEVVRGPLVHNVVATGRVATPSRVLVGAEISGLVLERRVMDGDRVEPGDLLVVL